MSKPSRDSPRHQGKPKPVASMRHSEENLAKVAGFTEDAERPLSTNTQVDDWESWWGQYNTKPTAQKTWFRPLLICLGVSSIVGVCIPIWRMSKAEIPRTGSVQQATAGTVPSLPPTVGLASEEIAQRFLNAETIEDRLQWVRNPEKIAPLMTSYEENLKVQEEIVSVRKFAKVIIRAGFLIEKFHVATLTGNRLLAVCETSEGRLVDWECFTRFNPTPWRTFLNQAPNSASSEFRVFVIRSDFYIDSQLETERTFYKIESPDLNYDVYGYVDNGTKTARALSRISAELLPRTDAGLLPSTSSTTAAKRRHRAILSLRHVSRSNRAHIVKIENIKHLGWVTPD